MLRAYGGFGVLVIVGCDLAAVGIAWRGADWWTRGALSGALWVTLLAWALAAAASGLYRLPPGGGGEIARLARATLGAVVLLAAFAFFCGAEGENPLAFVLPLGPAAVLLFVFRRLARPLVRGPGEGAPAPLAATPGAGCAGRAKAALDYCVAALAVVALAPLMGGIALLVRWTSPGPALYRQERVGLDGARFCMYKFRSMRLDAEAGTGAVWTRANDPRRTRLGAFLRGTSLDELPQLFNVLRGEMSLVGPRPERPAFVEEFRRALPDYMLRHRVKAGMTGWAQVNGWRGDTSIEKRLAFDLHYIENWSLAFDLKILWLTLWRGLVSENAY